MTSPSVPGQLESAWDELDMAQNTLEIALDDAHRSALHSTYTAAIKRILAFNKQTMTSVKSLLLSLQSHPSKIIH